MLEKPTDFSTVKKATVYDLKKEEAGIASLIGYVTERTELLTRAQNKPEIDYLFQDVYETLLWQGLSKVKVASIDAKAGTVHGKYNGSLLQWKKDMPVFFSNADLFTDMYAGNGWWLNSSLPMKPVGKITEADGENVTIALEDREGHCLPSNLTKMLPTLLIPVNPTILSRINATLAKVRAKGTANAKDEVEPI